MASSGPVLVNPPPNQDTQAKRQLFLRPVSCHDHDESCNLNKTLELDRRKYLLSSSRCGYIGPIILAISSPTRDVISSSTTEYGSAIQRVVPYGVLAYDGFRIQLTEYLQRTLIACYAQLAYFVQGLES